MQTPAHLLLRRRSVCALPAGAALLALAPAGLRAAPLVDAAAAAAAGAAGARIATLAIPGDARFVAIARDVLLLQTMVTPDFASQSGLVDDALRLPSFAPARIALLTRRLRVALHGLRALPWRQWDVDRQIDVRWVYANAERLDRELNVERLYLHRPGALLETLANNFIAILTYAPDRRDAVAVLVAGIPGMVSEMSGICAPTEVDAKVALGVLDGVVAMLASAGGRAETGTKTGTKTGATTGTRAGAVGSDAALAATSALAAYRWQLQTLLVGKPPPAFSVIGASNYAWRLQHASLLPWTPASLLALAEQKLAVVDEQLATLVPQLPPPAPLSPELQQLAQRLDQRVLLDLYDRIQTDNRAAIEKAGFVTIPPGVGPVRARVTPDAMVPLTGDGGSMNPPPPFLPDDTGWWNVEHFNPSLSQADRERVVRQAALYRLNSMGPYAVHEGLPGHHLQLAIARLNPNPLRSLFQDAVQNEGWALYAEQLMWEQGGLGDSPQAQANVLRSWRFRIRRVVYDVKIETGAWTLQQAADWKSQAEPGKGRIDPDVQRAVNWPAQLVCYFAGKEQILALKADFKRKLGDAYAERRFHDELLALGSVPYVFARAKLLGEPVPGF